MWCKMWNNLIEADKSSMKFSRILDGLTRNLRGGGGEIFFSVQKT